MRSMIVSPEEQVRNVANTLLNVATEPGRRRNRKGDHRSVVEGLAAMIERLVTGDLKPIEVALGDEPFSLHPSLESPS